MITPEPTISQAAKDAAGKWMPDFADPPDPENKHRKRLAEFIQRAMTQETAALREKLSETQAALESKNSLLTGTEGERDDARDEVAALQAQLDEARRDLGDLQGGHELTVQELHAVGRKRDEAKAEIVALRSCLADAMDHGLNGNRVYDAGAACETGDEAHELLHRTAASYEGLVVVPKAEWDKLTENWEDVENMLGEHDERLSAQSAKLSEAEKDTRRLDWLLGRNEIKVLDDGFPRTAVLHYTIDRAAIDAAIAKGGSA